MIATMAASLMATLAFLLIQAVVSLLKNTISGKGVTRVGKGKEGEFLSLLELLLRVKVQRKEVRMDGKRYNSTDHKDKSF